MLNKTFVDRQSRALVDGLPSWLPYCIGVYVLTLMFGSLSGTGDVRSATNTAMHRSFCCAALCFNVGLAGVGLYVIGKTCLNIWDAWNEYGVFVDRMWDIAKQGATTAGMVGSDLGMPDRHGVYSRRTRTGGKLYLRMARGSMSGDTEHKVWQWSQDKRLWTSAAKVDQYWNAHHSISGMADKVSNHCVRRQRGKGEKHPFLDSSVQPPALELHLGRREEKQRLSESVPRGFLCPISMEIMTQPVVSPSGITYDRHSLTDWIEKHHTDPATQAPLRTDHCYPNLALRDMIQEWLVDHKFLGTEA